MKSTESQIGRYKRIGFIVIWAASLVFASSWGQSQTVPKNSAAPTIISGSDLGFRVDERSGDVVAGTLVVRINGEWLATGAARTLRPAATVK
jgi:hypothetical protein